MKWINWKTTKEDALLINQIVDRAFLEGAHYDDRLTMVMDITAVHLNGCPLDLQKLLDFPSTSFAHDLFGIVGHLDRKTGKLNDCFIPRSAMPEARS
jgi:hypothetical protein